MCFKSIGVERLSVNKDAIQWFAWEPEHVSAYFSILKITRIKIRQALMGVLLLLLLYTEGFLAELTRSVKIRYENTFFREGER